MFILLLGFFLRFVAVSKYPFGFTADEASQGYTAYSILKTGRDEWGIKYPITPRSFGDFKAPLLTYVMIPSVAFFGLNEFAVRLPNVVFGGLAVIVVYFLVKELCAGVKQRIYTDTFPMLAALLLAISPWHISLSRGAFEANLTTFFLALAVLFFLKGMKKPKGLILASFLFGLNLFSYHSAKIVTPFVLSILIIWQKETIKNEFSKHKFSYISSIVIFLFFLMVTGLSFINGAGSRVSDIGLFSSGWQAVSEDRFFATQMGLPDFVSRIFNNKLIFIFKEFTRNYFSYLSPQFLFTQGAGEATYGMLQGLGVLYLFELPFVLAGLYFLLREKRNWLIIFFVWILLSPIPASLARGVGYHANRVAVMMPAIQIISAYGAIELIRLIKKLFPKSLKLILLFYSSTLLLSLVFFLENYFFQAPEINAPKMSYGWQQAVLLFQGREESKIIISRTFSEPQAFVMFYEKLDPVRVQKQTKTWLRYEDEGKHFVDQLGTYSLGKFEFRNFSFPEDWQRSGVVLVGTAADFLTQGKEIAKRKDEGLIKKENIILYPDSSIAFRIFNL